MKKEKEKNQTAAEIIIRLREYSVLKKEIAHDRARIAQLEHKSNGNPAGLPLGADMEMLEGYRAAVKENLERCCKLLEYAQRCINEIEDSEMRRIFTLYYINGWSWQRVAFAIGMHSEASARIKHNRFIENLVKKTG